MGKRIEMKSFLLINPNTNEAVTQEMVRIARASVPDDILVEGTTVLRGHNLIYDDEKLAVATKAVVELSQTKKLTDYAGIIISAFGDPGIDELRALSPVPISGIAEAGILEAAENGRRFSIVTTTPDLVSAIHKRVARYGFHKNFAGVRLTEGEVLQLMSEPERLTESLARACEAAIADDGAEAIIIGGGPLASHAATLKHLFSVAIIEPVPAGIRLALARAKASVVSAI
jgi:Asp/Glu/hydantoin racemase